MAEKTAIGWTDHTFNPWWGCERVSPGCQHCYAETFAKRLGKDLWGKNAGAAVLRRQALGRAAEVEPQAEAWPPASGVLRVDGRRVRGPRRPHEHRSGCRR
jgi:protein gp37